MSLLMDALRKAEAAKRQGADPQETAAEARAPLELSLEPVPPPPAGAASPLPDLALHLDSVGADLATMSPPPPRKAPPTEKPGAAARREEAERTAARNVFAVKQAPASKKPLWLALGLGGAAALAIGAYFWWQLQTISGVSQAPSAPPATATAAAAPVPAPALLPPAQPPGAEHTTMAAWAPSAEAPAQAEATRPPAASPPASESPIRLKSTPVRLNPVLAQAYEALQADRLEASRHLYGQVLRDEPMNLDALLGMASIASRRGEGEQAEAYYSRALEADPHNADAQAALIGLRRPTDPTLSESRLKTLLATQPDSAALHFALGNLLAAQNRWPEAQQAYFRASGGDPENADYLFNLAVSLDHLRQPRLAAQYYRQALAAAESRTPAFDRAQAARRILELQP